MTAEIKTVYELLKTAKDALPLDNALKLPVGQHPLENIAVGRPEKVTANIEEGVFTAKQSGQAVKAGQVEEIVEAEESPFLQKDYVKYPLIFLVSFGLFYFFLNYGAFSDKIGSYFAKDTGPKPEITEVGQVLGAATPEYAAWIKKYFYYVNDQDSLSPNFDYDRDGLTNFQEFLLGTNPTKVDTDNDAYGDGQEILNGYNPLYEGKLTTDQQQLIKDWDLQEINNRISYYAVSRLAQGPAKPSNFPVINYDLSTPGEINIPKLGVKAPVIWSKSENSFTADLESGVIHYPGTSYPGQAGVAYVSGHSSNYIWSKSIYSHVFSRINELKEGDEFFVTVPKADGGRVNLRYVVVGQKQYQPDDQSQFETSLGDESVVNISTCWPLGTTSRRLVVSAKLAGV